jgi:hypothetical protein
MEEVEVKVDFEFVNADGTSVPNDVTVFVCVRHSQLDLHLDASILSRKSVHSLPSLREHHGGGSGCRDTLIYS